MERSRTTDAPAAPAVRGPGRTELIDWCCGDAPSPATHRPRLAVVAAHADDETVGAGARLLARAPALLVHVTDGAPRDLGDARRAGCATREAYAALRRAERDAAAARLGVSRAAVVDCDVVDQEASLAMSSLARRLASLLDAARIDLVLTHPYEGGHPDHDATAVAVHAARALLARDGAHAPAIAEFTSYHLRDARFIAGEFLHHADALDVELRLDHAARGAKRALLDCYVSQRAMLAHFPLDAERFRLAPAYDFAAPPHAGRLHYEWYPWGMDGARWRALACEAAASLGLDAWSGSWH